MDSVEAGGARIPSLGLGTWTLRGRECADLVAAALDAGYRHIDTARLYDNEAAVGEGLRASGVARRDIFLTTKLWWSDLAPGDLERAAAASVKRLNVDQVDLLLIHWPNGTIPIAGTMKALNAVRAAGLTRHIGVSNFPTALLKQAIAASEAPIVCNQVEYHPYLDQTTVLDFCRDNDIALVAYCPLYRGGGLLEEAPIAAAAARHGKTPAQVVLRWHVQQPGVVAIPRTSKAGRLAENAAIFDFDLTDDEMAAITALRRPVERLAENGAPRAPAWDA
ncbi:MAG: aldo/keto reductase [Rhizobiaceae bacterium]|nr:aldo/keto reductase [Rhizobiaceae bacterium]